MVSLGVIAVVTVVDRPKELSHVSTRKAPARGILFRTFCIPG